MKQKVKVINRKEKRRKVDARRRREEEGRGEAEEVMERGRLPRESCH